MKTEALQLGLQVIGREDALENIAAWSRSKVENFAEEASDNNVCRRKF